jgi:tryptophan-rich sensory protein
LTFDSEYEPFFQPPGWIVGPVWAVLYTCIAVSFYMVLSKRNELNYSNIVIALFIIQLALNLAWPSVFNDSKYLQSLLMIGVMIVFSTIYAYMIYDTERNASYLIWPYIAWVTFAGIINAAYYLEAS